MLSSKLRLSAGHMLPEPRGVSSGTRTVFLMGVFGVGRSAGGCGMLWLLLCVFPPLDGSRTAAQDVAYRGRHGELCACMFY